MRSIITIFIGLATAGTLALTGSADAAGTGGAAVSIDGQPAGVVAQFSGLAMEADILANEASPAPLRVSLGPDMGAVWSSWLGATTAQGFVRRTLDVVAADNPTRRVTLREAIITSVTVPKLDGSSKDAAYFDVEVSAERLSSGKKVAIDPAVAAPARAWSTANFRVEMGGLPCGRVASVDSFTWRQDVPRDPEGKFINPATPGGAMKRTTLRLSIDAADQAAWTAWQQQFLAASDKDAAEKSGTLRLSTADNAVQLAIQLIGVGFVKFSKPAAEANSEKVARFNVELYVEKMAFKLNYVDSSK